MPPRRALVAAAAFVGVLVASASALAQDPPRQSVPASRLDSILRRVQSMEPRAGPPGTHVTLRTGGMPHLTPLRIGVGAVRFGFEEIDQVMTDERGEFSLVVTVPGWARRDLTHRFIVFDFYFVPIALSEVFYVTDADGLVSREGVIERGTCLILTADDSMTYSLTGVVEHLAAGMRATVEGHIRTTPTDCPAQIGIDVVRVISR